MTFFRSLATLMQSGVSIPLALRTLARHHEDPALSQACLKILDKVNAGSPLSEAAAAQHGFFSTFQLSSLRVGEKTGQLDEVLRQLADYEEKARDLRLKLKAACIYPLFVFAVCLIGLLVLPPVLFAHLVPLLQGGQKLPWCTQVCMALSRPEWLALFLLAGLLLGLALRKLYFRPGQAYRVHRRLLSLPGIGPLLRTTALAQFARAMAMQLQVGVEVRSALSLATECSRSPVLGEKLPVGLHRLTDGAGLAASLASMEAFPKAFLQMVSVAEQCGELADMMERVADLCEGDLVQAATTFSSVAEPVLLLAMGLVAGFIMLSIMLPLVQFMQSLL